MQYKFSSDDIKKLNVETVVCFTTTFNKIGKHLKEIDTATGRGVTALLASGEFSGKAGEVASFTNPTAYKAIRLLLAGLGDEKDLAPDSFRKAMGTLSRNNGLCLAKSAAVHCCAATHVLSYAALVEGYILGSFKHLDYKTGEAKKDKSRLAGMTFAVDKQSDLPILKKGIQRGRIIAEGQIITRRLAATPAADLTPRLYARKVQQLGRKHGFKVKVLDKKTIVKEKMGCFLSVAAGSEEPPTFIIMEHRGGKTGAKPVVLVGKGVTFDSGGISLKPGLNMHEMKQDMAGSAAVVGAMCNAARLKLKLNVVALIPATENMPSGHATRPGDIIKSRKGKTVEIINTDAEGRLILADALDYANKFKPQAVIDIATLTGASLYILGYAGAPIMGNDDELLNRINDAADSTAERVWPLPIWDDMREQMKSPIADLVNSGGRPAGTIAAGAFLEYFIGDWPWAHIDIAYVDAEPKGRPYLPKGATGFGARLLTEVLANWKKL